MNQARILIAGIGNIFLGDDAFGVEVAQRLSRRPFPEGVVVRDFGIRGIDLAYALLDDPEAAILIDAAPRGGAPGTLYVLEIDGSQSRPNSQAPLFDMHSLDPVKVLELVRSLGGRVRRLFLVGCEPGSARPDALQPAMCKAVQAAVDEAVPVVERLAEQLLAGQAIEVG